MISQLLDFAKFIGENFYYEQEENSNYHLWIDLRIKDHTKGISTENLIMEFLKYKIDDNN